MRPYYSDDLVTIYHGDCREWMPEADVIVTDPPYGIGWNVGDHRGSVRAVRGHSYEAIVGDDVPFDPAFLVACGLPMALFGANHYASRLPDAAGWLVWDKRVGMGSTDQSDCELVWTNVSGRARMIRYQFNGGGSLGKENGIPAGRGKPVSIHPSQKPVAVMRQIIQWMPEGTILDPYAGSGSTLVAAKSLGRKSIGIEIEERYCEIAATRCSQEVLGLESA
jgi:site-specific DNA-methyltransferase (adenine-specific)